MIILFSGNAKNCYCRFLFKCVTMSVSNLMDELQYFVSGRKKSGIIETIGFKLFLLLDRSYNVPIFNRGEVLCYVKQSIKFPYA